MRVTARVFAALLLTFGARDIAYAQSYQVWDPMLALPQKPDSAFPQAGPAAINDSGAAAINFSYLLPSERRVTRAYVYERGVATDIGTLGGSNATAAAMNNAGLVVGSSTAADGSVHAFLYKPAAPLQRLGLQGEKSSEAVAINDRGDVVGTSTALDGTRRAFLFTAQAQTTIDLNTLLPSGSSLLLQTASAIGASGLIVGRGFSNGVAAGYSIRPTEPVLTRAHPMWPIAVNLHDMVFGDSDNNQTYFAQPLRVPPFEGEITNGLWTTSSAVTINDKDRMLLSICCNANNVPYSITYGGDGSVETVGAATPGQVSATVLTNADDVFGHVWPSPAAPGRAFRFHVVGPVGVGKSLPVTFLDDLLPSCTPLHIREVRAASASGYVAAMTEGIDGLLRPVILAPQTAEAQVTVSGSGTYGDTVTLSARLAQFGCAIAGQTITFSIDGVVVGTALTDADGAATLTVANTHAAGVFANTVTASFAGAAGIPPTTATGVLSIARAIPIVTWQPAGLALGGALGSPQLNAFANVAGFFHYQPGFGFVPASDQRTTLTATFTPNDRANYEPVSVSVPLRFGSGSGEDYAVRSRDLFPGELKLVNGRFAAGVESTTVAGQTVSTAYLFDGNQVRALPATRGYTLQAMNASGQLVGDFIDGEGHSRPFVYTPLSPGGEFEDLTKPIGGPGALWLSYVSAQGITDSGDVYGVVWGNFSLQLFRARKTSSGWTAALLMPIGNDSRYQATTSIKYIDVNAAGQIAGPLVPIDAYAVSSGVWTYLGPGHGFFIANDTLTDFGVVDRVLGLTANGSVLYALNSRVYVLPSIAPKVALDTGIIAGTGPITAPGFSKDANYAAGLPRVPPPDGRLLPSRWSAADSTLAPITAIDDQYSISGINNAGQVTGYRTNFIDRAAGFLYGPDYVEMTGLGGRTFPRAIAENGDVIGLAELAPMKPDLSPVPSKPFLYRNGRMFALDAMQASNFTVFGFYEGGLAGTRAYVENGVARQSAFVSSLMPLSPAELTLGTTPSSTADRAMVRVLLRSNGTPIVGLPVEIAIDANEDGSYSSNEVVGSAVTDSNGRGRADVSLLELLAGRTPFRALNVRARFSGNYLLPPLDAYTSVELVSATPTANPISVFTRQGDAAPIVLTAVDPFGLPMTFAILSTPAHGTLSGTAPNLTYTPAAGYTGPDSFTFSATNTNGATSAPATVTITVSRVNHAPVAAPQSVNIAYGQSAPVVLGATDVDADPLTFTVGSPQHGTLTGTPPQVTYAPSTGYSGPDAFTFTASDGIASSSATVTLTIAAPPAANGDVVLYASDARRAGAWVVVDDPLAAGGKALRHPNANAAKLAAALASPVNYFELTFSADAGAPYHLWMHAKADANNALNDSVFVQFSGSVNRSGSPVDRITTTSAQVLNLEECTGCGLSGWAWEDNGWGAINSSGPDIYFGQSGTQTVRVQTREDGLTIDQIVLSRAAYLATRPSAAVLPKSVLNEPPSIALTTPVSGSTFAVGGAVGLAATASDLDGSIARVEFYDGLTRIGTDVSTPFSMTWTNAPAGGHSLTAVAFDNAGASTTSAAVSITVGASTPALPTGWQSQDVGTVGLAGAASASGATFSVDGSGTDIWGTADAFRFVYRPLNGDGSIVARVASVQNIDVWTKSGVMVRESLDPRSANAAVFVTPGKGVSFQRRTTTGGSSVYNAVAGTAPQWIKLERTGSTFRASRSADGSAWTPLGTQTIAMAQTVYIGLAVTSHNNTALAKATFDGVAVTEPPAAATWEHQDVGSVGAAGSFTDAGATKTVVGAGADIWGSADAFHFAYKPMIGDGELIARVTSVQNVNVWTKAGLMIRESLQPGATHASVFVTPGKGVSFQRRTITGGTSIYNAVAGTAPRWVKIVRQGSLLTGYVSTDGTAWTLLGTETISMGQSVYVGLAVTSHTLGVTASATFDNVSR